MATGQIADLSVKLSLDGAKVKTGMKDIEKRASELGGKVGKVATGIGVGFAAAFASAASDD